MSNHLDDSSSSPVERRNERPQAYVVEGLKTLPLYVIGGFLCDELKPFGRATVRVAFRNPQYEAPHYESLKEWHKKMSNSSEVALSVITNWEKHLGQFMYYVQFRDDSERSLVKALHNHTALVSWYGDSILKLDTQIVWDVFDGTLDFETIHQRYRHDDSREAQYERYCGDLDSRFAALGAANTRATRFVERLVRIIAGNASGGTTDGASAASPQKRFAVALSFPGEHREFVQQVADVLSAKLGRDRVLFDTYHEAEFARARLGTYLPPLYHDHSELIAVFLCADYRSKEWCGLEWDAIFDLIKKRRDDGVMLLRFDNAEIDGLYSTHGYVWVPDRPAEEIAELILERHKQSSPRKSDP